MISDGYYLSTYLHIDPVAKAIDWWLRHDQNFSLWRKSGNSVTLVRYWELERFTGEKQHRTPFRSQAEALALLQLALRDEGLSLEDISGIFGTPGLDTLEGYDSSSSWPEIPYHTVCHLFSSLPLGRRSSRNGATLALALDGGPDRVVDGMHRLDAEYGAAVLRAGRVDVVPIKFSPGRLWYLARQKFRRREGTLMALQTACTAVLSSDGVFQSTSGTMTFDAAYAYLDEVWKRCAAAKPGDVDVVNYDERFTPDDNRISMYVKVLHALSVSYLEDVVACLLKQFGLEPDCTALAMAGGFALNCPTNSHLLRKFGFSDFFASPCVNDTGISLGAAIYLFHRECPDVEISPFGADVGRSYSSADWESEFQASPYVARITDLDTDQWLADIQRSPIIWFSGRAEIGPRALGFRSLLGDPRQLETRDFLNRVKSREWWRPVAPIAIEDCAPGWFEDGRPSPYMLLTSNVKVDKAHLVPAVIHLDGTARVQTASIHTHPDLYPLLVAFHRATGVPMLANTSLNAKDEPIVCAPAEALRFAISRGIRVMYIDGKRLELDLDKASDAERMEMKPLPRPWASACARSGADDRLLREILGGGVLSREDLSLFCRLPAVRAHFDIHLPSLRVELASLCRQIHAARAGQEFESTAHEFYSRTADRLMKGSTSSTFFMEPSRV